MPDIIRVWLIVSVCVTVFSGVFAAMAHDERDHDGAAACARIALTSVLWPIYLVLLAAYMVAGLVGLAMQTSRHPFVLAYEKWFSRD